MPYNGKHQKAIVYGSISTDNRGFFRMLNSKTFLSYLKALYRHFGKIHVIMDGATPHTSKDVRKFIAENPDVQVTFLPTATPELSAIEGYWRQAKHDIIVSEYYVTFVEMKHTLSEYLRTHNTNLDVIGRKSIVLKNF